MDKSDNHSPVLPRVMPRTHYFSESAPELARVADASDVQSFDNVFNRIRDRMQPRQPGAYKEQSVHIASTIANMMLRIERAPGVLEGVLEGACAGQWSFEVPGNPMGISEVLIQRSELGSWRVGISLNQINAFDKSAHAEDLKAALLAMGYNVDSVRLLSCKRGGS